MTDATARLAGVDTRARLDAIEREQARQGHVLDAILALLERRSPRADPERHARLIRAIASVVAAGDVVFTAAEVLRHADVVGGELRQALDACGITDARKLGKRLQALVDTQIRPLIDT